MTPPVAPRHPGADHHNAVLDAARARVDELEPKLAAALEPILRRAGDEAARRFQKYATNHLTAAGPLTGVKPTSTMICVRPRPEEAAAVADPDGAPASDLHCTLAFLGEIEGPLDPIREAIAVVAGQHGPLSGVVAGYGEFRPPDVGILLPDVPGLVELRCAVTEALVTAGIDYSRDHGFQPHITVDGSPEDGEIDEMLDRASGQPLHFDALLIVRGDAETVELPLVGPRPITADGQPPPPDWTPPAAGELVDTDALAELLRGKTDPIRLALIQDVLGAAFGSPQALALDIKAATAQTEAFAKEITDLRREGAPLEASDPQEVAKLSGAAQAQLAQLQADFSDWDLAKYEARIAAAGLGDPWYSRLASVIDRQPVSTVKLYRGLDGPPGAVGETLHIPISDWSPDFATASDYGDHVLVLTNSRSLDTRVIDNDPPPFERFITGGNIRVERTETVNGKTYYYARQEDPPGRAMEKQFSAGGVTEGAGVALSFDVGNPLVDGLIAKTGQHITGISETTQANVMRAIGSSYQQGLSIPDTAKVITQVMHEAAGPRSIMIARTEMTSAVNGASLAAVNLIGQATGKAMTKTWLTAPGALYPRHEEYDGLDGQTVAQDETFTVGEDELQYPGDPDGSPEEVINCFPGSTLVVASEASVGFRRRYVGSLVRVETGGGHMLSGTPNHPVLTSSGWKPLHLLQEGDYLVCGCRSERAAVAAPDVDDAPTPIQQVVGALARRAVTRRVRGGAMQFHGDGLHDGEVEVVASHRALRVSEDAAPLQPQGERLLVGAHEVGGPLSSSGSPREVGLTASHASDGIVGGAGEPDPLLRGRLAHPLPHGGGTATRLDAEFSEVTPDDSAADAVALGQRLLGDAFEVSLAKVVTVKVDAFHGEVFNLQTQSGAYLAEGIIAHNCRCAMTYSDGSEVEAE